MIIVNTSELLDKIAHLTTALTRQHHAVSFSMQDNEPSVQFICRGDSDAECHFYADCYCEFELHTPTHKVVQQRRCYLSDLFTFIYSTLHYDGEDSRFIYFMGQVYAFPKQDRTGFIKVRLENGYVFWSWLELSDLELQQVGA